VKAGRDVDVERLAVGERQAAFGAVGRIEKADAELVIGILPAGPELLPALMRTEAARAAAENIAEDAGEVVRIEARPGAVFSAARRVAVVAIEGTLGRLLRARCVDFAAIEAGALFGIGKEIVGRRDL
jgi:hypothetical protein